MFQIILPEDYLPVVHRLVNLASFTTEAVDEEKIIFQLSICPELDILKGDNVRHITDCDIGNGVTQVDLLSDGTYQLVLFNTSKELCAMMHVEKEFRKARCRLYGNHSLQSHGLNNVLMMLYAFAGASRQTLLIHASVARQKDWSYAFLGVSGTGKSTHVGLWLSHIPDTELLNDDNPIIRIIAGEARIYGSPWSGKTPCFRNRGTRLGGIVQIVRDKSNFVNHLTPIYGFSRVIAAISGMRWDKQMFDDFIQSINELVSLVPTYDLHCLPNREAAIVCHAAIKREEDGSVC